MKNKILIATGITVALVSIFLVRAQLTAPSSNCVDVYLDYGVLNYGAKSEECIAVKDKLDAMTVFNMAGAAIIGTDKYGLQIVCRVNGFPNAVASIPNKKNPDYVEKCADMPAEYAYWALLVKRGTSSVAQWGWSDKGIQDLELNAGDSVALVFTTNDNVRWPK